MCLGSTDYSFNKEFNTHAAVKQKIRHNIKVKLTKRKREKRIAFSRTQMSSCQHNAVLSASAQKTFVKLVERWTFNSLTNVLRSHGVHHWSEVSKVDNLYKQHKLPQRRFTSSAMLREWNFEQLWFEYFFKLLNDNSLRSRLSQSDCCMHVARWQRRHSHRSWSGACTAQPVVTLIRTSVYAA